MADGQKSNQLHIVFSGNPDLQLFFGLIQELSGFPEGAAPCPQFPPGAAVVLGSVHLQKEVISLLQGFLSGRKRNDRVADLITLQLVPADFIVHDRHIEGISGELLEGHPDHPAPAGDRGGYDCQAAQSSNFMTCFHLPLSSHVLKSAGQTSPPESGGIMTCCRHPDWLSLWPGRGLSPSQK